MIVEIIAIAINIRKKSIPPPSSFFLPDLDTGLSSFVPEVPASKISQAKNLINFPIPVTKSPKALCYFFIIGSKGRKKKVLTKIAKTFFP